MEHSHIHPQLLPQLQPRPKPRPQLSANLPSAITAHRQWVAMATGVNEQTVSWRKGGSSRVVKKGINSKMKFYFRENMNFSGSQCQSRSRGHNSNVTVHPSAEPNQRWLCVCIPMGWMDGWIYISHYSTFTTITLSATNSNPNPQPETSERAYSCICNWKDI